MLRVRFVVHDDSRLASPTAKQFAYFAARMLQAPDFWVSRMFIVLGRRRQGT